MRTKTISNDGDVATVEVEGVSKPVRVKRSPEVGMTDFWPTSRWANRFTPISRCGSSFLRGCGSTAKSSWSQAGSLCLIPASRK